MSEAKWTPGRLIVATGRVRVGWIDIVTQDREIIAQTVKLYGCSPADAAGNADRIAACWNACEGIADPAAMRKQRDALLAALTELEEAAHSACCTHSVTAGMAVVNDACTAVRAAIAKATE